MNVRANDLKAHLEARRGPVQAAAYPLPKDGVSISWLAQVFGVSQELARYKLKRCPVKGHQQRGKTQVTVLYDVAQAAKFLAVPDLDSRDYLKALKKGDLPPALTDTVWAGLLKRQQWEENAGDLWRTEKVREVLASTFQGIKFNIQLWTATVEGQTGLTREQRDILMRLGDALQNDIYNSLVEKMGSQETQPQLGELPELVGEEVTARELIEHDGDLMSESEVRAEIEELL